MSEPEKQAVQDEEVHDAAPVEDEGASTDLRYQITSYGADYPVDGLVKRLRNGDIELPKFQRDFVWPLGQASRFIESLLLGLPIPAIFLSKEPDSQKLLIIDGQQRLKSLLAFYDGILRGKEFRLEGVNKEFEGATYKSLSEEDRRRLDDALLHAIIIRQEDPKNDDSSVFLVFERLNTTSTPLSEQELRACVYHGPFNDYLDQANKNPAWRAIYGEPNLRQKDKELLLRFFALYFDLGSYDRPMKLFLTNFMRKNRDLKAYPAAVLDKVFVPTVALAMEALGRAMFRPERALNASVADAILVGLAQRLSQAPINDKKGLREAIGKVLGSEAFAELYRLGTTNKDKVTGRIAAITNAIGDVH
jgi:hypothetical protein